MRSHGANESRSRKIRNHFAYLKSRSRTSDKEFACEVNEEAASPAPLALAVREVAQSAMAGAAVAAGSARGFRQRFGFFDRDLLDARDDDLSDA